jgi:hypothetical protein
MRVNDIYTTRTRVNDIAMRTFKIICDNLMRNGQKWPRNGQEMTEMTKKWPRNDQEMAKK